MNHDNEGANKNSAKGIGFSGLLTIAFVVLKLCHVIDWPWVWVISPIWISVLLSVVIIAIVVLVKAFVNRR